MKFEQYQEEDGKNIINIIVEKDDNSNLKNDVKEYTKNKNKSEIEININKNISGNVDNNNTINNNEKDKINTEKESNNNLYSNTPTLETDKNENYKKYQYILIGGIIFTFILLIVLLVLYKKGF